MFNKEKNRLITENEKLLERVRDLEFRICKGRHNYTRTGESTMNIVGFDFEILYERVCLDCGKKIFE